MTASTPADLGDCTNSSTEHRPIELSAHNPWSQAMQPSRGQAGCGLVALLRNRGNSSVGALARLFCKRRRCVDCGPRRADRERRRYLELLSAYLDAHPDARLATFTIAKTAWASCSARLRRHRLPVLQAPDQPGFTMVITLEAPEAIGRDLERVEDLGALLARVFAWTPERGFDTRRARAVGWDVAKTAGADAPAAAGNSAGHSGSGGADAPGWDLVALVWHSYHEAITIADRRLQLDPHPVPEHELRDDWAEAHTIRLPLEDTLAWRVMWRELHCSDPAQWSQHRQVRGVRKRLVERRPARQDRLPGIAA
jgi:hypothetical protein